MPEEQYDININYDANVDGALDDLDELDDQLGQTEDATEGQGRAATGRPAQTEITKRPCAVMPCHS